MKMRIGNDEVDLCLSDQKRGWMICVDGVDANQNDTYSLFLYVYTQHHHYDHQKHPTSV